jgi:hypothetical protein
VWADDTRDEELIVVLYAWIMGEADGIIIAAIITAHIVHISTASPTLHAEVIGIAKTELLPPIVISPSAGMSPISERRNRR